MCVLRKQNRDFIFAMTEFAETVIVSHHGGRGAAEMVVFCEGVGGACLEHGVQLGEQVATDVAPEGLPRTRIIAELGVSDLGGRGDTWKGRC